MAKQINLFQLENLPFFNIGSATFLILIIFLYYYFQNTNKEKICFAIPSTTNNRDWKNINETYLYNSINNLNKLVNKYDINIYISYDVNDNIYSISKERDKLSNKYNKFNIIWFKNNFEKRINLINQRYEYLRVHPSQ